MQDVPTHVAIIMDGNRRWAVKRGLPKMMGHREGIKSIERVMKAARDTGVKILTLYTFSTENWKRSKKEVDTLMNLLDRYLDREYKKLADNGVKLMTIGRMDRFSPALRRKIEQVKDLTKANSRLILNLALDYGGRSEIASAVRKIADDLKQGKIKEDDISEELFSGYLFTSGLPDPDLLIRTGGEYRLSNFLLWQLSYAEIYVSKRLWPDFGEKDFKNAIRAYGRRDRRLGA